VGQASSAGRTISAPTKRYGVDDDDDLCSFLPSFLSFLPSFVCLFLFFVDWIDCGWKFSLSDKKKK
jgi:hypothetical protein